MTLLPEVRNLRFATNRAVPRHWHGGRRSVTTFFDNLSVFFPAGERFFVTSVRAHDGRVTDAELRAAMRLFCGQEGVHSREHVRYNEMLTEQGYPVPAMERRVKGILGRVSRRLNARQQLAVTCALEHFTALLGQLVLTDPEILAGADATMAALWRWHSAEENEHKAVAFDVYEAVGGTYRERVLVMLHATVIFWAKVLEQQARMMKVDGTVTSPREWADLVKFLFVAPGGMLGVARHYFDYFRPGFHPNDIDSAPLTEAWKRAYSESLQAA
jgi:predicted metal-dependent hydrolase